MTVDVLSYRNLVHAMSGAVGSVTAMTVFYPLDTARLRLQVDEKRNAKSTPAILAEIVKEEGLLGPYRGWFPVMCSLCCSSFVYFYCFQSLKTSWLEGQPSTPMTDLMIGILAGVINVLVTSPLWVVNTRLKLQGSKFWSEGIQPTNYSGILDGFAQIVHTEGVGALWSGTLPSLLLVLNPAIQFTVYESLKRQISERVSADLSSLETFLISSLAKTVSTTVTYPMQTVQSVLRLGHYKKSTGESRLVSSLMSTKCLLVTRMRKCGVLGLFKGLEAKLLQTVLTAGLMFILYEKLVSCTFRVMGLTENHEKKQ